MVSSLEENIYNVGIFILNTVIFGYFIWYCAQHFQRNLKKDRTISGQQVYLKVIKKSKHLYKISIF